MTMRNLAMAFLITSVLGVTVTIHNYETTKNMAVVRHLTEQLQQTKAELAATTVQLSDANSKLEERKLFGLP